MISSQLLLNFSFNRLNFSEATILSVSNDKLLISDDRGYTFQFLIYSCEGHHRSNITTNNSVYDATWTPHGYIVYTAKNSTMYTTRRSTMKIVVMTEFGEVISEYTQIKYAEHLSVFNDVIYLTASGRNVHQSTDDGISWSHIFKSPQNPLWSISQLIRVTTNHSDDFWILNIDANQHFQLGVCSVDMKRSDDNFEWRIINVKDHAYIAMHSLCSISYDGKMFIFLGDFTTQAVHVFSVNGQYHCQLLSEKHLSALPIQLSVDKDRQLLYVSQTGGVIGVLKLIYGGGE